VWEERERVVSQADGETITTASTAVTVSIDVALPPEEAFTVLCAELTSALVHAGMSFQAAENGRITQGLFEVGHVVFWQPPLSMRLEWNPNNWSTEPRTELELRLDPVPGGTRVTLREAPWGGDLIGGPSELVGWFAGEVVTPLLEATSPVGLGNWITDRRARRPSGGAARAVYRSPLYHYPNFYAILELLKLSPDDNLVEVGCGGGAFLHLALAKGCRAAAVDHSYDMVQLAAQVNQDTIADGRLRIELADADVLPFPDLTFTAAVMTGVLGFLPHPVAALGEIRRVLTHGGRLVLMGSDPALRGTPAAPEPMASRLRFYTDEELHQLGVAAGFDYVEVVRRDLEQFARQAGVPEEALPLFAGPGTPFLLARKSKG
jgi:ubiquinone/menaquinone biosynthesis C-methylase UbiE